MFEWDPEKNADNLKKHGIGFEEAKTIFKGPVLTAGGNGWHGGEFREKSIGRLNGNSIAVIVVIHTDREGVTRIISARKAAKRERKLFDDHIKKTHS